MTNSEMRQRPGDQLCGLAKWHPARIQRYANTKTFMLVYGMLGTIQATAYMYFVVTLTTIEKRFKIPSQTTGLILSGNEISQILLSLILTYIGGQRNRPRWIAWGIVFCGLSCYILALPHCIYGPGDDALHLTLEYQNSLESMSNATSAISSSLVNMTISSSQHLCSTTIYTHECEALLSVVPLVLIFLSQFVLGVGNTLYYSLGQTYLDDNTKKTNTPLMLAVAMSLRMIGPIMGFFLGYVSLNTYIDPTKTPLIDNSDPRWLGAWWLGWMILGTLMIVFSGLIGLFPKVLPKKRDPRLHNSHMPQVLRQDDMQLDEGLPLGGGFSSNATLDVHTTGASDLPKLKDFPKALMRLLRNKLLIYNIVSAIFYLLGATGYMTFLSKYMEVQFHKSSQSGTIVVGPLSIIGMVVGLIVSGVIISKKRPSPSKVLMWNVIVGVIYIIGQTSYLFMYCGDSISMQNFNSLNLTVPCNSDCSCEGVSYSPVCHKLTETTYFSPCHAGCLSWDSKEKLYSECSCISADIAATSFPNTSTSFLRSFINEINGTVPKVLESMVKSTRNSTSTTSTTFRTTTDADLTNPAVDFATEAVLPRSRRSTSSLSDVLTPGVCLKGCEFSFWVFSITSMIVNWFGSSGRIGNILVNYRAVSTQDKSFAQGLSLMMVSLFALIPGPIIFGRIIDSTCLIWTKTCSGNGNCQLYNQTSFRYYVNILACSLTVLGVIFDVLVWYYGRHLDLYGEKEAQRLEEMKRKNKAITPLLAKK